MYKVIVDLIYIKEIISLSTVYENTPWVDWFGILGSLIPAHCT